MALTLPASDFLETAEKFVGSCDADTYVLVNQPGLRRLDFLEFQTEFASLRRYVKQSSTAIKFEKVELLSRIFTMTLQTT